MPQPIAELLSQGDELTSGEVVDTNSAWLARQLHSLGFVVSRKATASDNLDVLVDILKGIAERADLCLCTGGLGPTCDDLTAEAAALAFDLPLQFDAEAFEQIGAFFAARGRDMPDNNRKQAMLPATSARLDNRWGTAPGFSLRAGRCQFFFMPGPPGEMQPMFQERVGPTLRQGFALQPPRRVLLHTLGSGESVLQQRLGELQLPPEVGLGFRTASSEITVKLKFPVDYPAEQQQDLIERAVKSLEGAVYAVNHGEDNDTVLEDLLDSTLAKRRIKLYTVETVSRGGLARRLAPLKQMLGGTVSADVDQLAFWFGIENADERERMAEQLAKRVRTQTGADWGLAQVPGRVPLSPDGPLPLYLSLSTGDGHLTEIRPLARDPSRQVSSAVAASLDFLRRCMGLKL